MSQAPVVDVDMKDRPIVNEKTCTHFMLLAFVQLFPFGRGAFADPTRPVVLIKGQNKFYAHLVSYFDRRYV